MARYHAAEHVLLCSSGTVAEELALRGLQIQPDDEVILAAYDFQGTFQNVLTLGSHPVLVDVDAVTDQLDVTRVAAAITEKTQAVIASHLHGGVVIWLRCRRSPPNRESPLLKMSGRCHWLPWASASLG